MKNYPDEIEFNNVARMILIDYTRWLAQRYNLDDKGAQKPVDAYMEVMQERITKVIARRGMN